MSDFEGIRGAIRKEDLEHVKRIFTKEYINFADDMGWTPLHWACGYNKNISIVQYLLDEGCDIEAETLNNKWRPIHLAVFNGSKPIVKELIDRKCQINTKTAREETPLDVAIEWKREECVEMLKKETMKLQFPEQCQAHRQSLTENTISTNLTPSLTNYKKGIMLGRGGFGVVHKCFDLDTGQDFAMKEVKLSPCNSINKEVKSLENEINIYKNLINHPRIVQYYGTIQDHNSMYIFMEFMAGGSIRDQINLYGPLTPNIICRYVKHILEGLMFLHDKSIIHRDIKASNILRDIHGNVKLSDFGTSRYFETISLYTVNLKSSSSKTKRRSQVDLETTSLCGTYYWMAPEVIRGEPYNISADVWSLGATVVEMLTGNHPYHELEPVAAMFRIGNTRKIEFKPPQPISHDFKTFIGKLLIPDKNKRPNVEVLLKTDFILKNPCLIKHA